MKFYAPAFLVNLSEFASDRFDLQVIVVFGEDKFLCVKQVKDFFVLRIIVI